jgi:hypothetical protein
MHLSAQYDAHSSKLSEKLTFYSEKYELTHADWKELREKKLLKLVKWAHLPENIPCQVLVYCEGFGKVKVVFFNHTWVLPEVCFDEPLLNKDLIKWSQENGGFWIEFLIPLDDSSINLDFTLSL